jgi:hypothetical protein
MAEMGDKVFKTCPDGIDDANSHGPHIAFTRTDLSSLDAEELPDAFLPLVQQFDVMHENQCRLFAGSDYSQGAHSFACPSGRLKHSLWALQNGSDGLLLVIPERSSKGQVNLVKYAAVINPFDTRAEYPGQLQTETARHDQFAPFVPKVLHVW